MDETHLQWKTTTNPLTRGKASFTNYFDCGESIPLRHNFSRRTTVEWSVKKLSPSVEVQMNLDLKEMPVAQERYTCTVMTQDMNPTKKKQPRIKNGQSDYLWICALRGDDAR